MGKGTDIAGHVFGKWKVISDSPVRDADRKARWLCECACGTRKTVDSYSLRSGDTKSCGKCSIPIPSNTYEVITYGVIKVYCVNERTFLIDKNDLPLIKQYQWHVNSHGYVVSGSVKPQIRLHRFLMGLHGKESGIYVDHISGDTTDNRKNNLRVCSCNENCRNQRLSVSNRSGFKGVSYWQGARKYVAEIVYRDAAHVRHRIFLGHFDSAAEAARAYDRAALFYHGSFAKTNAMLGAYGGKYANC